MSVQRRSALKAIITHDISQIENRIMDGEIPPLVALQKHMQMYLEKVQVCDEEILQNTIPEHYSNVLKEQSDYYLDVEESIQRINVAIDKLTGKIPVLFGQTPTPAKLNVKLPKLDIPPYEGDIAEWRSFWELYNVSVHARNDLDVQKFF